MLLVRYGTFFLGTFSFGMSCHVLTWHVWTWAEQCSNPDANCHGKQWDTTNDGQPINDGADHDEQWNDGLYDATEHGQHPAAGGQSTAGPIRKPGTWERLP